MNHILRAMALALAALAAFSASAQAWPDRPVTLVVPFPAGGSTDQVARAVAPRLGEKLRQSFVVENKAGATGTIGAAFVQRAAGSLDAVRAVARITVYVRSAPDFTQQSEVADGASDLIARVLGPVGAHTRTSVGVLQLPKGAAVELDLIARVD
ncbi:MAG TPA: RidA family protein [Delftia acidovorans]|nr:RidA family protein [Delftia acidovorans]